MFEDNTGDPETLLLHVERVRERLGLTRLVLIGDRRMVPQTRITTLKTLEGVIWITAISTETSAPEHCGPRASRGV